VKSLWQSFLDIPWVERLRWRMSRRKIARLERRMTISRRGLFAGAAALFFTPLSPQQIRERIISEYLMTATGRAKLHASMILPLRRSLDYTSIGRKVFHVEQLPQGALPIYDRDPEVASLVVGDPDDF